MQDPTNGEFQHQYFRKDRPDLLALIKRKANNRATETFKKLTKGDSSDLVEYTGPPTGHGFKPVIPPSSKREGLSRKSSLDINNFEPLSYTFGEDQNVADLLSESDELLSEINQQQEQHQLFEKKLEDRLGKLEGENQMLKQLFIESHNKNAIMQEKMDRVMKTIYHVFMGAGSINGKALKNKTPVCSMDL